MLHNPVVRGIAPDPSACRVGDDFFLATSTMDFWPGIPIRHSRDLVSWQVVGHAAVRPEQCRRDRRPGPVTLYAPTLRHHAGRFWLACTNAAEGQGNFVVSAADPAGPWSDAVWVDGVAFDPSLAFDGDDDGATCYYTRRTLRPGVDGLGPIVQAKIDLATGGLATDPVPITPGGSGYCSNDIEGPHLYHVGEWWYLFSAEGGTWKGHMQTVARSRSPWGPFEGCPHNPVLTHRHRVGHPVQTVGHAELLTDPAGWWWAVFLATRHDGFTPHHQLGRETFLAPVRWEDGWPVIGDRGSVELTMPLDRPLPGAGVPARPWPHERTPWTAGWQTRGEPAPELRLLAAGDGWDVHLPGLVTTLDDEGQVSAAFLRQEEPRASFGASLESAPAAPGLAGVTVYATPSHHYELVVSHVASDRHVTLRRRVDDIESCSTVLLPGAGPVRLEVSADTHRYTFTVSDRAGDQSPAPVRVGTGGVRGVSAEAAEDFSGVRFGVVSIGATVDVRDVRLVHVPESATSTADGVDTTDGNERS